MKVDEILAIACILDSRFFLKTNWRSSARSNVSSAQRLRNFITVKATSKSFSAVDLDEVKIKAGLYIEFYRGAARIYPPVMDICY